MDIFNNSVDARSKKKTVSHHQSSNKTIVYDVKLLQSEIVSLKNNISTLQERIKSLEDSIRQNNKSLLDSESRISQLFDNYSKATTLIGITRGDVIRINDTISHITQELKENSLSDHELFIAQLHAVAHHQQASQSPRAQAHPAPQQSSETHLPQNLGST
ncbi:hypothetical protein QTP88_007815 [Uroleucon formosanum]